MISVGMRIRRGVLVRNQKKHALVVGFSCYY